jgi:hypothetical protein
MSIDLFDPPAPAMPERELTRRRAHLLQEIDLIPAVQPRSSRDVGGTTRFFRSGAWLGLVGRRTALTVALAALIAALAAVLPGQLSRNQMTLVDQAVAAIGNGTMIHVVLDEGRTSQRVDLHTGKTTLLRSGIEVWSDPKLGTVWISTLDGQPTQKIVAPTSQHASASAWWRPYVSGYRNQLRTGAFHLAGTGQVEGHPVDWIRSKPFSLVNGKTGVYREVVTEIAISRTTYKPLFFRQRINGVIDRDSGVRVTTAETLPPRPSLFKQRTIPFGPGLRVASGPGTGIPTTLSDARAAMKPDPIVPSAGLAHLHRTWIGMPDYLAPPYNSYLDQIPGVQLYYGRLDSTGHPTYKGSFISITEFPHRNSVINFNGISLFQNDVAIVSTHMDTVATMKTHGLYVIIQAGSQDQAIAAARALAD